MINKKGDKIEKNNFFLGFILSWIILVLLSYMGNYLFLGDFWQANVNLGFARSNYMNPISILGYLIITLVVVFMMVKNITWLKNDARSKGYVLLIGFFYGVVFAMPFLILNLFFNIMPVYVIVKLIEYPVTFIITAFVFVYLDRFKLRKIKRLPN